MRYSAPSLMEAVGIADLLSLAPEDIDEKTLVSYIEHVSKNVRYIPRERELQLDTVLAKAATEVAVKRHVGRIETVYGPMGASYVQYGKDLTEVKYIIGTGGALVHSENPGEILAKGTYDHNCPEILAPISPEFLVDSQYLLSSIGLLSEVDEVLALKLAKRSLQSVIYTSEEVKSFEYKEREMVYQEV